MDRYFTTEKVLGEQVVSLDLFFFQNVDFQIAIKMSDLSDSDNPIPFDLEDFEIRAQYSKYFDPDSKKFDFTVSRDNEHGIFSLELTAEDTAKLIERQYFYDVVFVNIDEDSGNEYSQRLIQGRLLNSEGVTNG